MSSILYLALLIGQAPDAGPAATAAETESAKVSQTGEPSDGTTAADSGETSGSDAATPLAEDGGDTESEDGDGLDSEIGLLDKLDEISRSGAIGFLRKGGLFMWPILFLGILAAGVIIERYRSLRMLTSDSGSIRDDVQQLLREDRIEEAMQLCDHEQGPVPAILSAGLR
ncbi:MAG: hypothetical protein O3B86_09525, partial [Planctomycetota bacterium]|nr:hypothetical protein [Planctomycetota bacterium]